MILLRLHPCSPTPHLPFFSILFLSPWFFCVHVLKLRQVISSGSILTVHHKHNVHQSQNTHLVTVCIYDQETARYVALHCLRFYTEEKGTFLHVLELTKYNKSVLMHKMLMRKKKFRNVVLRNNNFELTLNILGFVTDMRHKKCIGRENYFFLI